jgi:hypothetical protein
MLQRLVLSKYGLIRNLAKLSKDLRTKFGEFGQDTAKNAAKARRIL